MAFSVEQMARELSLDPVYLAQLESGFREVDDWYIKRAEELERSLVKNTNN